jgi:hypothetical protein
MRTAISPRFAIRILRNIKRLGERRNGFYLG